MNETTQKNASHDDATDSIVTDVLIAGGGPCGLMLAIELGRRGVKCLLVDPKPSTAFNPQANATQARTMEHFRRIGIAEEIRALGMPADHPTDIAYFTRFAGYELARLKLPTAKEAATKIRTMSGSWSAAELPHRVSQKFVESTLRKHAEKFDCNDLRYNCALNDFSEDEQGINATVQAADGSRKKVRALFLVGADGARSLVRNELGIKWGGVTGMQRQFMGGKMFSLYLRSPAFLQNLPHPKAWMYVSVNAERRAFMASVDGVSEYAIHSALHPGENADEWTEDDARRIFRENMGIDIPIEILSMGTWLAGHALVAEKFQSKRVFIAGDAAHLFTPTGGLGYNTAVEDAVNLGWKLASVIKGVAPLSLLESYEAERKPLAQRNTAYARQFADSVGLFEALPVLDVDSPDGAREREKAAAYFDAHVRLEFNIPGVTFGGRYDASPIIVADGTSPPADTPNSYEQSATPGGRPPHMWLPDGRSLYDTFHSEWTLLLMSEISDAEAQASRIEEEAKNLGIDLRVVSLPLGELRALYAADMALIRPDQIVAWRGDSCEPAGECRAVLSRVMSLPAQ